MISFNLKYLLKVLSPNTLTQGLGAATYEFGGDKILSKTMSKLLTWKTCEISKVSMDMCINLGRKEWKEQGNTSSHGIDGKYM